MGWDEQQIGYKFQYDATFQNGLLSVPVPFSFTQTLAYLERSTDECLYQIEAGRLHKVLNLRGNLTLCELQETPPGLQIAFLNRAPTEAEIWQAINYIWHWFDLGTNLAEFYQIAAHDSEMHKLVQCYDGLRLIGLPDLFEALCWAIIGQQINLNFAYRVKRRFVESFGEPLFYQEKPYWAFPTPARIAELNVDHLRPLQFSSRKAEYIIGLAHLMVPGTVSKDKLLTLSDFTDIQKQLEQIRGIGRWTAHYALMRCFRYPRAFPIDDVGLHNAIKQVYGLAQKPTLPEIRQRFAAWSGWEAYATFYLWRALIP